MPWMISERFPFLIPLLPILFKHFNTLPTFVFIKVALRYHHSGCIYAVSHLHLWYYSETDAKTERSFKSAFATTQLTDFNIVRSKVITPMIIFLTQDFSIVVKPDTAAFIVVNNIDCSTSKYLGKPDGC